MSRRLDYTVPPELSGRRIRSILQNQLGLSAGLVTRLRHRENAVLLNGRPARTLDPVRAGDRLSVEVGDEKKGAFAPGGPRLEVLWEDEDILIINKPADMAVHGRSEQDVYKRQVKSMERRFEKENENMTEMPEQEGAIFFKLGNKEAAIPARCV